MSKNIPVFILAGGLGTRLSEETQLKPKPMVEVGGIPILLHIMRAYYQMGFDDFVICAGYRSWDIKNFFLSYQFRVNHLAIDHRKETNLPPQCFETNQFQTVSGQERWRVRVLDTGIECMTGGRLARAIDLVCTKEKFTDFAVTYGDGISDVNLSDEFDFHRKHGKIGTVLGVRPNSRFGVLSIEDDKRVTNFVEKPEDKQDIVNGGFFFFKSEFRKYLQPDDVCVLERQPLDQLARDGQLLTYRHSGFWQPMDTLRDRNYLEDIWASGKAPWLKPSPLNS